MLLTHTKLHTCRSNIAEWLSCVTSLEARERVILLSVKEKTRRSIPAKYRALLILKRATLETRVMAQAFHSLINWILDFSAGPRLCHSLSHSWGHHQTRSASNVTSFGHVGEGGSDRWAWERRSRTGFQYPGLPGQTWSCDRKVRKTGLSIFYNNLSFPAVGSRRRDENCSGNSIPSARRCGRSRRSPATRRQTGVC